MALYLGSDKIASGGSSDITEIIENENGKAIKYSNGVAICYKTASTTINIDSNAMSIAHYRSGTVNVGLLPLELKEVNYFHTSGWVEYTTEEMMAWSQLNGVASNTNFANIIMFSLTPSTNRILHYSSIVIGKWK